MPQWQAHEMADARIISGRGKAGWPSLLEKAGSARDLRCGTPSAEEEILIDADEGPGHAVQGGQDRARKGTPPLGVHKKASGIDKWAFDSHAHAATQVQSVFRGYLGREKFRHAEQTFVNEEIGRQIQQKRSEQEALRARLAREEAEMQEVQRRMKLELEELQRLEQEAAALRAAEEEMLVQQRKVQEEVLRAKEIVRSSSEQRLLQLHMQAIRM